ncbi:GyrI-like domain-containing protein [Halocola ammonii]
MPNPEIVFLKKRKLVGINIETSFGEDRTAELWSSFMPRKKEIENRVGNELISLQHYPADFDFQPQTKFTKWALVKVSNFDSVPEGMKTFELPEGLYATYLHKGTAREFQSNIIEIYTKWLPASKYELDDRPHFEVLGKNYKGYNAPDSEEEVWIPVREKE